MAKLAARNLQALIAVPARLAADVLQLTRQADSQYYTMLCDNAQMQVLLRISRTDAPQDVHEEDHRLPVRSLAPCLPWNSGCLVL